MCVHNQIGAGERVGWPFPSCPTLKWEQGSHRKENDWLTRGDSNVFFHRIKIGNTILIYTKTCLLEDLQIIAPGFWGDPIATYFQLSNTEF